MRQFCDAVENVGEPSVRVDDCPIKGNISSKGDRIYHVPGSKWYERTRINPSNGERWFCSEAEALGAGWRPPRARTGPPREACCMCGRYQSALSAEEIARWFRVPGPLPNIQPRWNAAPTQSLPVVRLDPESRRRALSLLRWGLIPHWARDPKIGYRTINARAETVRSAHSFRAAFARRRCIVPAGAFYEWQKTAAGKVPHAIVPAEGEIFGFAGLWEGWQDPDSGEWLRTFTIITGQPNELVAPIHDRMPVILEPEAYAAWLGETDAPENEIAALLRPIPAERMRAWAVSTMVNNVRNDGADLLTPV